MPLSAIFQLYHGD